LLLFVVLVVFLKFL
jgi:hypothetical protein